MKIKLSLNQGIQEKIVLIRVFWGLKKNPAKIDLHNYLATNIHLSLKILIWHEKLI